MCDGWSARRAAGNTARFFEINRDFHRLLVHASGNRKLEAVHAQLIAQMGRLMSKSAELRGGLEQSAAEHRAILAAIDAGDAALAARLLEEHIEVPQRVLHLPPRARCSRTTTTTNPKTRSREPMAEPRAIRRRSSAST